MPGRPRPRLWLLDEPTAGLDRASAERLVAELSRIVAGVTAIVATHDPAAMTLGQRTVELGHGRVLGPAPASFRSARDPARRRAPVTRRPAASGRRPGLDGPARRRALAAAGIGVAGELGAIGLLATGAWLLLSASFRPPVLLLSMAIGAVQLFAFLRGSARYGERLASHNLGLGLQAALRAWLYGGWSGSCPPGCPAGPGRPAGPPGLRHRGGQDLVVRAAVPVLVGAVAWGVAVVTAGLLLRTTGWVLLTAGVLGAAGVATAVAAGRRPAAALPAARGAVSAWVLGTLASSEELAALGADDWPWPSSTGASARWVPGSGPLPRRRAWAARRRRWPAAAGWPGSPGRAAPPCAPGRSARSSWACWSSWPWAQPGFSRDCRTR